MTTTKNAVKSTEKQAETKNVNVAAQVKANIIEMLVKREQHFIYKAQAQAEKLPAKKAKQFRQKMRRILENFYFAICIQKDSAKKESAIKEFIAHYKMHYLLNDFSLASLTDSRDENKKESYKLLLSEVQKFMSK